MSDKIIDRILRQIGVQDLLDTLGERLEPTDLQSLLLAVFHKRAERQTPARVLQQYEQSAFVRPSQADPVALLEIDQLAFGLAVPLFDALELGPLAPLGTCSAVATIDQNRVVSTIRNTEVVSDATNVLALECAVRRRGLRRNAETAAEQVRVCASMRLTRAQRYTGPNTYAHFRMFSLCTAGRSDGVAGFEAPAAVEQLTFYLRFLGALAEEGYTLSAPRVSFTPLGNDDAREALQQQVIEPLAVQFPDAQLAIDPNPTTTPGYYEWVRFMIYARDAQGAEFMIGDGGLTDWTRQLLSDRRERLLTSGIATERVAILFKPTG